MGLPPAPFAGCRAAQQRRLEVDTPGGSGPAAVAARKAEEQQGRRLGQEEAKYCSLASNVREVKIYLYYKWIDR